MTSCEKKIRQKNSGRKFFFFGHFGWISSAKNATQKSGFF